MNCMKKSQKDCGPQFYGTTVVGERGQAVIPAEAREALGLKKGDKLLVFGMGNGMLSMSTLTHFEHFQNHMNDQIKVIQRVIGKNK